MSEISKYTDLKTKLDGICDANNLVASIHNKSYPFYMTIKPIGGADAQMSMLEEDGEGSSETGYLSPEASLLFAYRDGDLVYKMSETINISDNLFRKLKNLFTKLNSAWMMYYFRERTTSGVDQTPIAEPEELQDAEPMPDAEEDDSAFEGFTDPE